MEEAMKVKVNLTLESEPWKKLRVYAIEHDTSASAIIDELIANYLKRNAKKGGK
jgi:hypothetical protein